MMDMAELKLLDAVVMGQPWAILFYLKTQGKDRGYVERSEQLQAQTSLEELVMTSHIPANGKGRMSLLDAAQD